jgi:tRNA threonylcarbamoyladenosine biosynthesis protein TsaB
MKTILAIETATPVCSVSLFIDGVLIKVLDSSEPRSHVKKLPVFSERILKEHHMDVKELDGIAVSSGPGSYTGLRIGMSFAKGLAYSHDIPLIPVPTLMAINIVKVSEKCHWTGLHSHKDLVFAQQFEGNDVLNDPQCLSYSALQGLPLTAVGMEEKSYPGEINHVQASSIYIGEIALREFQLLKNEDIDQVTPLYLTEFNLNKK